jgi:hypothetical protein
MSFFVLFFKYNKIQYFVREKEWKEIFVRKFFSFFEIGQKKCPKSENEKKSLKNSFLHCIIKNYRKDTQKKFFKM